MISASYMEKASQCLRKSQLDRGQKFEQGEAGKLGDEVHETAEMYHTQGKAPNQETWAGKVFMPALPYLPPPLTGVAEGRFKFKFGDATLGGYMDLRLPNCRDLPTRRQPIPEQYIDWPCVIDYKSTKDPKNKMLEEAEYLTSYQPVLYAYKAISDYPFAPGVVLRWIWLRSDQEKEPRAWVTDVFLTREQVSEAFMRLIAPMASGLTRLRRLGDNFDPMLLPFNADTCYQYGPKYACSHVDKCKLTGADLVEGRQEYDMEDLLAKLEKEVAGAKGINPTVNGAGAGSGPAEDDEEAKLSKALEAAKAKKAAAAEAKAKAEAVQAAQEARGKQLDAIKTSENPACDSLTDAELGNMVRAIFRAVR